MILTLIFLYYQCKFSSSSRFFNTFQKAVLIGSVHVLQSDSLISILCICMIYSLLLYRMISVHVNHLIVASSICVLLLLLYCNVVDPVCDVLSYAVYLIAVYPVLTLEHQMYYTF